MSSVDTTSFTVFQGATQITGEVVQTDLTAETYEFSPTALLPSASVITVNLSGAITNTAVYPLVPLSFSFTTM